MVAHTATFSRRFDADHRSLSTLRGTLRDWLRLGSDTVALTPDAINDLDLVVTELGANVIDHTSSAWIQVDVTITPSALVIEVSHSGDGADIPDVASWGTLTKGDRGRGLRIVRAVCDEIEVRHERQDTAVRCRMVN